MSIRRASLVLLFTACAHQQASVTEHLTDSHGFPQQDALLELARQQPPPAEQVFGSPVADVESFELQQPLPDLLGSQPATTTSALGELLAAAVAQKPGLVTVGEEMNCVARQVARFQLQHQLLPGQSVQSFMQGRCGVPLGVVQPQSLSGTVPAQETDAAVMAAWKGQIDKMVAEAVGTGTRIVGSAFLRDGDKVSLVVASGERMAHLQPVPGVGEGGSLVLKGELLLHAESARAVVTYGEFGARPCEAAKDVALPAFSFTCPLLPSDESAYVQVLAFPPGRILGHVVLTLLARPAGGPVSTYHRPKQAAVTLSGDAAAESSAVSRVLNEVRTAAGLQPLRVAPAQSEIATQLAPHYFAAAMGMASETIGDLVVLGLQAGWKVDALVSHGSFASAFVLGTGDLGRLVSAALEMPSSREALLDATAAHLAVGVLPVPGGKGVAGIFATYSELVPEEHQRLADAAVHALDAARQKQGLPPAERVPSLEPRAAELANQVQRGIVKPEDAANDLMHAALKVAPRVQAFTMITATLADMQIPDELAKAPGLKVAPAVAVVRFPGQAWAAYIVVMVYAQDGTAI